MPVKRIVLPADHEPHPRVVVKKGSIPPYKLPPMLRDTAGHRRMRCVSYCLIALYVVFDIVMWIFEGLHGKTIPVFGSLLAAMILIPTTYYGMRPGKGNVWWITGGVILFFIIAPPFALFCLTLFPLFLLGRQGIRAFRNR